MIDGRGGKGRGLKGLESCDWWGGRKGAGPDGCAGAVIGGRGWEGRGVKGEQAVIGGRGRRGGASGRRGADWWEGEKQGKGKQ